MHTIPGVNDTPLPLDPPLAGPALPPVVPASPPRPRRVWATVLGIIFTLALLASLAIALTAQKRVRTIEQELARRQQDTQSQATEARLLAKRVHELREQAGWDLETLETLPFMTFVRRLDIEFVRPVVGDQEIVIVSFVREFVGHGIGRVFHEDPQVLHYGRPGTGAELVPGMTITVEPMVNAGKRDVKLLADGWTVVTKDHSLSAQWEHTVLVTDTGFEVLTLSPGAESN